MKTSISRSAALTLATALVILGVLPAYAGGLPAPRLYSIFPPGGQRGTRVDVLVRGVDLDQMRAMRFSHSGLSAEPKKASNRNGDAAVVPGRFIVTIAPDVPPGTYEARVVTAYGISTPLAFTVGTRAESNETEPNDSLDAAQPIELGHVVNGRSDREGDRDFYRFEARQGERVIVRCAAEGIDSHFRPVLILRNEQGRILATYRNRTFPPMIDFSVPRDGVYVIEVYDLIYASARIGGPRASQGVFFYRLAIDTGPFVDFVFPPSGPRGSRSRFTVFGRNLPGGKPSDGTVDGHPLQRLEVEIALPDQPPHDGTIDRFARQRVGTMVGAPSAAMEGIMWRLPVPDGSAHPVFVAFASEKVVVEEEPNDMPAQAHAIEPPCEVVGQFAPVRDRDWFVFRADKGETFEIEVVSQRIGVPSDPLLVIEQVEPDGSAKEMIQSDDRILSGVAPGALKNEGRYAFNTNTDDPGVRFTAPRNGLYRIMVRDIDWELRGDPRMVYRLILRRPRPDFQLVAVSHYPEDLGPQNRNREPWPIVLRRGGTERIDVLAFPWDGFDGDIELSAVNLPAGVTCRKAILRSGQKTAALILQADESAAPWDGPIRIVGTATSENESLRRVALAGTVTVLGRTARFEPTSRLTLETFLSVIDEPAPVLVTLGTDVPIEAKPKQTIEIPVSVVRRGDFGGAVQLLPVVLPGGVSASVATIAAGQSAGKVELTVGTKTAAGDHDVVFEILCDVPYRRIGEPKTKPATKRSVRLPTTPARIRVRK